MAVQRPREKVKFFLRPSRRRVSDSGFPQIPGRGRFFKSILLGTPKLTPHTKIPQMGKSR
jgi:hypothetical protein